MRWLENWWQRVKLARGQCVVCRAILRDDETSRVCSERCADEVFSRDAW